MRSYPFTHLRLRQRRRSQLTSVTITFVTLALQHYSLKEHHYHTIWAFVASEIPQTAGVGYMLERNPDRQTNSVASVGFGEGDGTEGDFHAGILLGEHLMSLTGAYVVFLVDVR